MNTFYKTLNDDGTPAFGGVGCWNLPWDGQPGEWMTPVEGFLMPCSNGYHLTNGDFLAKWLAPTIYVAEPGDDYVCPTLPEKYVCRTARLLRRIDGWHEEAALNFSMDCLGYLVSEFSTLASSQTRSLARAFAGLVRDASTSPDAWEAVQQFAMQFTYPVDSPSRVVDYRVQAICRNVGLTDPFVSARLTAHYFLEFYPYDTANGGRAILRRFLSNRLGEKV